MKATHASLSGLIWVSRVPGAYSLETSVKVFFILNAATDGSFSSLSLCTGRTVTQTRLTLVFMSLDRMTAALSAWIGLMLSNPSIKTVTFPLFCSACLSRFLLMSVYSDLGNAVLQKNSTTVSKLNLAALIYSNFLV